MCYNLLCYQQIKWYKINKFGFINFYSNSLSISFRVDRSINDIIPTLWTPMDIAAKSANSNPFSLFDTKKTTISQRERTWGTIHTQLEFDSWRKNLFFPKLKYIWLTNITNCAVGAEPVGGKLCKRRTLFCNFLRLFTHPAPPTVFLAFSRSALHSLLSKKMVKVW